MFNHNWSHLRNKMIVQESRADHRSIHKKKRRKKKTHKSNAPPKQNTLQLQLRNMRYGISSKIMIANHMWIWNENDRKEKNKQLHTIASDAINRWIVARFLTSRIKCTHEEISNMTWFSLTATLLPLPFF